jgi:hypothetical protein
LIKPLHPIVRDIDSVKTFIIKERLDSFILKEIKILLPVENPKITVKYTKSANAKFFIILPKASCKGPMSLDNWRSLNNLPKAMIQAKDRKMSANTSG